MNPCPSCNVENPPGSKFCAGCGGALPRMPVNVRCASCGAESPEGSRFCKGCGRPVGEPAKQDEHSRSGGQSRYSPPPTGPKAAGEAVQRIKALLGGGAALYVLAIFLMYSELARIRAALGPYAGQVPGAGLQWFLIILDAGLAAGNIYALTLVVKGDFKYAKWLFVAMAVLGAIFLLRGLSGPVIFILLNAALLASGVWGWRLASRQEKGPAAGGGTI